MFFTSFFSRDSAYETIISSLDLNPLNECFDPNLMDEEAVDDEEPDLMNKGSSCEIVHQEDDIS
jgi:hypothetical protein